MANKKNLMPIQEVNSRRTREQHSKDSSKAGKKSGEVRRARKSFKEAIKLILETELKVPVDDKGNTEVKTIQEIGLDSLANKFMLGDLQTFLAFRDTIGEKPIDKQEVKEVTSEWYK